MIRSICLFALIALATAASLSVDSEWESFKAKYGKVYDVKEEAQRKAIFESNLKKVNAHNEAADNGLHTYRKGINKFSDLTSEEFKATRLGFRRSAKRTRAPLLHRDNDTTSVPTSVDWREKNLVTGVKDQGQCGSCWAFSAVAALESANAKKTSKLVSCSEENIVDCSWDEGNEGCDGGEMDDAFEYVKENKGIDTESCYPYTAGDGQDSHNCRYKSSCRGCSASSYADIAEGDENALTKACATVGVIAVAIDAEPIQDYDSGIFSSEECDPDSLDHGVAVVGYGVENGQKYWIVKNSWGQDWGESGYFRMERNTNMCGIAQQASYPIV